MVDGCTPRHAATPHDFHPTLFSQLALCFVPSLPLQKHNDRQHNDDVGDQTLKLSTKKCINVGADLETLD